MKVRETARRGTPILIRYGALAIQFGVVAMVARQLSTADAGIYLSLAGAVQASFFIAGLGIPDGMVRTVAEHRAADDHQSAAHLVRRGVWWSVVLTLPSGVIAACLCGLLLDSVSLAAGFGLWWLAYGFMFIAAQALVAVGRNQAGTFAFYALVNFGLLAVLVPATATGIADTLEKAVFATVIGAFGALIVFLVFVITPKSLIGRGPSSQVPVRPTSRLGVPIAANRVVQATMIWSPVWIAGLLFGPTHAGVVAVGSRLAGVVGAALAAINFSIRPEIVHQARTGQIELLRKRLSKVSLAAGGLVLVAIAGNLMVGHELLPILFGTSYQDASIALTFMLVASLAEGLSGASGEVVKMIGRPAWLVSAQVVALVLSVGGQFALGQLDDEWLQLVGYSAVMVVFFFGVSWRARLLLRSLMDPA